jgi:nicotinate phosphoribosyltransferase
MSIITSLLDTDLYKLTMMQCVLHQFPGVNVEYRFKCRNKAVLAPYKEEIIDEIKSLCELRFTEEELEHLNKLDYIKNDFIEFLRLFHLSERFIHLSTNGDDLDIVIDGPWLHTIMFEVPVLAIVNEVYFRNTVPNPNYDEGRKRLQNKIDFINNAKDGEGFLFSDFGTRRRFSKEWQFEIDEILSQQLGKHFVGTSNVEGAKKFNLRPIGTMAHEFLQACQAVGPRLADSQRYALEAWAREYRGRLGIALTDVINIDSFLSDFDLYYSKLFDGLRQDSGDPFEWGEKVIQHYKDQKLDPRTKQLIFSDSLTPQKAMDLYYRFKDRSMPAFGIGTNLTNDLGYKPINIVIKMTRCNGQAVAKISDSPGKSMCRDDSYITYLKHVFHINE